MTSEQLPAGGTSAETPEAKGPRIIPPQKPGDIFSVRIRGSEVPLATSGVAKAAVSFFFSVGPWGVEALRNMRDYPAEWLTTVGRKGFLPDLEEGYRSKLVKVDDKDCKVVVYAPVTQYLLATETSRRRVGKAVEAMLKGDFHRFPSPGPRLQPGKRQEVARKLPVAAGVARENLLDLLTRGIPMSEITIQADPTEWELKKLIDGGKLEKGRVSKLLALKIGIKVKWFEPSDKGNLKSATVDFPLGSAGLSFDTEGNITNAPYKIEVGGKPRFFHPAVLGLSSFAGIVSQVMRSASHGGATIGKEDVVSALVLAASASKNMEWLLMPHLDRMRSIDEIESVLANDPSVVLTALPNIIRMVDLANPQQIHKEEAIMLAEISDKVWGVGKGASEPAVSWHQFIFAVDAVVREHKAGVIWEGERLLIKELLLRAERSHELVAHHARLIQEKSQELIDRIKPTNPSNLLGESYAPQQFFNQLDAILEERQTLSHVSGRGAQRRTAQAQMLRRMSDVYTDQYGTYLDATEAAFKERVARLSRIGRIDGSTIGDDTVQRYTPKGYEALGTQEEAQKKAIEAPAPKAGSNSGSN